MSLHLLYSFREGMIGLRRARLATTVTISTLCITLTIFGMFLVLTVNVNRMVEQFKERMAFEVFIDESLSEEQTGRLRQIIEQDPGVGRVTFISKQMALERSKKELGLDPLSILGENPLPSSFEVQLKKDHLNSGAMESVMRRLENVEGVDEIVYHGELMQKVSRYSGHILIIDTLLLAIVAFSALVLVSNTLRLTLMAQRKTIEIMELVGAKEGFIQRPYVIQGIFQGAISGVISSILLWGIFFVLSLRFPGVFRMSPLVLFSPCILGILLGFFGSEVGLRRFR